jgi:glutamine amidotransferase
MKKVTIIDYGMSNLLSITRAMEHVGAVVTVTENADEVKRADYLVLPGVGAFFDGMNELEKRDLPGAIHHVVQGGKPFLGICLGMQMMLETGTEIKPTKGLGIVPGEVIALPSVSDDGKKYKVPHVCWNTVNFETPGHGIFEGIPNSSYMYFVHSFYARPAAPEHTYALTPFSDKSFSSVIHRNNAWGTQFHPEKSGETGLMLLRNFINL